MSKICKHGNHTATCNVCNSVSLESVSKNAELIDTDKMFDPEPPQPEKTATVGMKELPCVFCNKPTTSMFLTKPMCVWCRMTFVQLYNANQP